MPLTWHEWMSTCDTQNYLCSSYQKAIKLPRKQRLMICLERWIWSTVRWMLSTYWVISLGIWSKVKPMANFAANLAIGKPVALDASADDRDTRGFISMMTMSPFTGLTASCTFDPPHSTPKPHFNFQLIRQGRGNVLCFEHKCSTLSWRVQWVFSVSFTDLTIGLLHECFDNTAL